MGSKNLEMICKKCKLNIRADCMLDTGICVFCFYKIENWDSNGLVVTKQEAIGRDPKRIKRILKKLEKVWTKYNDWRFGQLLINLTSQEFLDLFYLEDNKLEELIEL